MSTTAAIFGLRILIDLISDAGTKDPMFEAILNRTERLKNPLIALDGKSEVLSDKLTKLDTQEAKNEKGLHIFETQRDRAWEKIKGQRTLKC